MLRILLARARAPGRLRVGDRVALGRGVRFDVAPGGVVALDDGCVVGDGTRFHVGPGAIVRIGAKARLGERCAIAARERVEVGAGARLGDEVVLIDFDPDIADVERPMRQQPLLTAPVVLGAGAVLDACGVVRRGVSVDAAAHVTTRAVVARPGPG